MCICIDVFIVVTYSPSSKILLLVFAAKLRFASIWIPVCIKSISTKHSLLVRWLQIWKVKRPADWPTTSSCCRPLAASPAMATTAKLRWHVSALSMHSEINYNICINEVSVESVCLARSYLEEILPTARAIREKLPAKYGTKKPQSYRKYWAIDIIRSQNYSKSSCICCTPRRSFISLQTQNDTRKCLEFTPSSWPARTAKNPVVPTTVKREPASIAERYFTIWVVF